MGIFTNPVTINDGTARSFEFVGQTSDMNSMSGLWIETAATLAEKSQIVLKHDTKSKNLRRSLLKCTVEKANSAGVLKPITVNFTVQFDPLAVQADVEMMIKRCAVAANLTGFSTGFVLRRT